MPMHRVYTYVFTTNLCICICYNYIYIYIHVYISVYVEVYAEIAYILWVGPQDYMALGAYGNGGLRFKGFWDLSFGLLLF